MRVLFSKLHGSSLSPHLIGKKRVWLEIAQLKKKNISFEGATLGSVLGTAMGRWTGTQKLPQQIKTASLPPLDSYLSFEDTFVP